MISAAAGKSSATQSAQLPSIILSNPVRTRIALTPASIKEESARKDDPVTVTTDDRDPPVTELAEATPPSTDRGKVGHER